ncbi:MAG: type II toxin-antitoxin system HicA family toxin [Bacteroidaceae bacterium]|nr:type II toxin-antitoxin system HicA family toxin [Bacteroidaceae bacterium]
MKTSEIVRKIRKGGCYISAHGAEHDEWCNPVTGVKIRIPRHPSKEIRTGLANKILKTLLGR